MKTKIWTTVLLATAFAGCQEAKFTGTTPARAKIDEPTTPTPGAKTLACAVNPARAAAGQTVNVDVTAANTTDDALQTVSGGGQHLDLDLSYDAKAGKYIWTAGVPNTLTFTEAGTYKISIKLKSDETVATTCELIVDAAPGGDEGGDEGGGDDGTTVTPPPPPQPPLPPPPPPCEDDQISIGAQIAFLIDNSSSNSATDCKNPTKTGTLHGTDTFACGSETNREKAVLAAYDLLTAVATKEPANALAKSSLAIASFPTKTDYMGGYAKHTSWIEANADGRSGLATALGFARTPHGQTPYGGALSAGQELFSSAASDERAKVAVLVTDGEPTDRKPHDVIAKAQALKAAGVEVITVYYSATETREKREAKHTAMLKKFDDHMTANGQGHWFDDTRFANFDAYIGTLLGNTTEPGVIKAISSQVVEVQDSEGLKKAFLDIIKTKAIQCQ